MRTIILALVLTAFGLPAFGQQVNITVDASLQQGAYPHAEHDSGRYYHLRGSGDINLIQSLGTQLERMFWGPDVTTVSTGNYNYGVNNIFSADVPMLDQQASYGAGPMFTVTTVPAWLADTSYSSGTYNSEDPPSNMAAYQKVIYDGLVYWKTHYPKFQYLEVWNEPDGNWSGKVNIPLSKYESIYSAFAATVASVNKLGLPGGAIKIGGPCAYYFDDAYIMGLMDYAKANNLPLDFVSWHEYGNSATPSGLQSDVQQVQGWLASRGMTADTVVTEWGINGNYVASTAANGSQAAAFAAVGGYYFSLAHLTHDFYFGQLQNSVPASSMLDYNAGDGVADPSYYTMKMMSMQKSQLVSTSSSGLNSNGTGVGAQATADGTGISILAWNYLGNSQNVSVNVKNLPAIFSGKSIHVQQYLVDDAHSNYPYNGDKSLDKVAELTAGPGSSFSQTVALGTNAVTLFVLTPSESVVAVSPPTKLAATVN